MVSSIETNRESLAAFRLTGALDKKDYAFLIPVLEDKISRFGKIDLYWEMVASEGWNLEGLWEDLKFDLKHMNSFRKVAIVGDKKWEEWIAAIIKPFTSAEIKYFHVPQREEAMAWVSR
jgi:hypothetical protein